MLLHHHHVYDQNRSGIAKNTLKSTARHLQLPARHHRGDLLESHAMDVSRIIESLNDAQREAVCAPQDPLLVLAGVKVCHPMPYWR
jgi:hypothetical protein